MNPGVEMLLKLARLGARSGTGRLSETQRAEMRGVSGVMNLEFTGPDGGGWHIAFADGAPQLAPGLTAEPRATVRLAARDFLAMVSGDMSISVARMTGKVRVAGDGHFGIIFNGFVGAMQNAQAAPGVRGWITRAAVRRALRKGGYTPRTERGAKKDE